MQENGCPTTAGGVCIYDVSIQLGVFARDVDLLSSNVNKTLWMTNVATNNADININQRMWTIVNNALPLNAENRQFWTINFWQLVGPPTFRRAFANLAQFPTRDNSAR